MGPVTLEGTGSGLRVSQSETLGGTADVRTVGLSLGQLAAAKAFFAGSAYSDPAGEAAPLVIEWIDDKVRLAQTIGAGGQKRLVVVVLNAAQVAAAKTWFASSNPTSPQTLTP